MKSSQHLFLFFWEAIDIDDINRWHNLTERSPKRQGVDTLLPLPFTSWACSFLTFLLTLLPAGHWPPTSSLTLSFGWVSVQRFYVNGSTESDFAHHAIERNYYQFDWQWCSSVLAQRVDLHRSAYTASVVVQCVYLCMSECVCLCCLVLVFAHNFAGLFCMEKLSKIRTWLQV